MKKILSLILAIAMAVTALSGCGKKTEKIEGDTDELTIFLHYFGYCVFNDEWPIFQKAAELTGVKLHGTASESISDSSQAWNTMLASKEFPDIICGDRSKLRDLADMGGLIPLDDLIEEYAPNVKKFFNECPEAKLAATSADGHIYFIPGSLSGIDKEAVTSKAWFIRMDWLKKLGLEVPKTVDEYYEVLKAFKTQDPNGNGKADEIPYFNRQEGIMDLFQLFGADYTWHEDKNGNLVYGRIEETYKNAIREIAKWYKEGLIDTEIYSRGQQTREQLLSQNIGGSTHDWVSSTGKYNDTYKDQIEGFDWQGMVPPADINGEVKEVRSRSVLHGEGWGISKDNKHIETTMKYFDFWMSDTGRELLSYGVEGIHYNVVDGKKVFTDEVLNSSEGVPTYMRNQGQVEIGSVGDIAAEVAGMNEYSQKAFKLYEDGGFVKKEFSLSGFTEEEGDELGNIGVDITTYIDEMSQKWILGTSDVDADWDTYIATIKKMGYDKWEKIFNDVYKRQNALLKK